MRVYLQLLTVFISLAACAVFTDVRQEFEQSSWAYNELLRWHDYSKAGLFIKESLREEFEARVKKASNVVVLDYKVVDMTCDTKKGEAEVTVEIDYYVSPSTRVKTLQDNQKWSYVEVNGKKKWRLVTLLPEFK